METKATNSSSNTTENSSIEKTTQAESSQQISPELKNPSTHFTAIRESIKEGVGDGPKQIKFFGPRFMTIWVMPIAVTGILMEFLFISPLRSANPFS